MSRMNCHVVDTRLVLVTILLTLCCFTLIDTAAVVRTELLGEHLQNVILHGPSNTRVLRTTEGSDKNSQGRNCYNLPCGWEVYNPRTRISEYVMKNECECPDSTYKCVRYHDVLQSGAYQYRCRQNTTADDIEYPKDSNWG
ncbi:uncharacterized protein LOC105191203 [Harpegnathos saltator]|uniref:Uncharacterized protein n=1 Tax=Harpegnathos saltator TaxID=610380 RepID=E2C8T7_HARSA|nr:uncharacterized protein LOC105191203 [Harpegnathos saltator]EFN75654.1 hypothetical protein EAI_04956 [Harpegnathos saltator]